jgi:hypothetical protein
MAASSKRPRPVAAIKKGGAQPAPEFNAVEFQLDDLTAKLALSQRENTALRARLAQYEGIIRANAEYLGVEILTPAEAAQRQAVPAEPEPEPTEG